MSRPGGKSSREDGGAGRSGLRRTPGRGGAGRGARRVHAAVRIVRVVGRERLRARVHDVPGGGVQLRGVRRIEGAGRIGPVRLGSAALGVVVGGLDPLVVAREHESRRLAARRRLLGHVVHALLGLPREPHLVGHVLEVTRRRRRARQDVPVGQRVGEARPAAEVPEVERLLCPLRVRHGVMLAHARARGVTDRAELRPDIRAGVVDVEIVPVLAVRVDRVQECHVLADSRLELADPVLVIDAAHRDARRRRRRCVTALLVDPGALRRVDELALGASEGLNDADRVIAGVAHDRHLDRHHAPLRILGAGRTRGRGCRGRLRGRLSARGRAGREYTDQAQERNPPALPEPSARHRRRRAFALVTHLSVHLSPRVPPACPADPASTIAPARSEIAPPGAASPG